MPGNPHRRALRTGVLLVNLGTPDAPTPSAVRRYLAQFLMDPRVIEKPRWLWWLILHGIILRIRPSRSARAYSKVWTPQGSPLLVNSENLSQRVANSLDPSMVRVELAMRYGQPAISQALRRLRESPIDRLLIVPLYPQYSATTSASVFDAVIAELQCWRWIPELRMLSSYHDHGAYISALKTSIQAHWDSRGRGEHLLMSFHGIPTRYVESGDPYYCQCLKTARLLADALELDHSQWGVSFQSRVGRETWIPPYTDERLRTLALEGVKSLDVVCPGFSADCLETLEEIALEGAETFLAAGGKQLNYIPALNAGEEHVSLIGTLLREHGSGWPGLDPQAQPRTAGGEELPAFPEA